MATDKTKSESQPEVWTPPPARKVKRHITLPLIKLEVDKVYNFRIETAIEKAKDNKGSDQTPGRMEPPYLCQVTDLDTGEHGQIIVPAVLKSILEDNFPDDSYKGRLLQIIKHKIQGKNYSTFDVAELEE